MGVMRGASDAPPVLHGVLAFHAVVAAAAHIPALEGMHQLVITSIKAALSRVKFVHDHTPLLNRNLNIHDDIVAAISVHDPRRRVAGLWAIAAHRIQAPLAPNRPDGMWARGPSMRSEKTVSMIAFCRRAGASQRSPEHTGRC